MNQAELKNNLHTLVVETEDIEILTKIKEYFSILKHQKTDWWDTLDDNEKENIQKGIDELRAGQVISHEDVRLEINKILNK